MKKKSISDYLKSWYAAAIALLFFISAGVWVMALAGEVKQTKQRVDEIELNQLNSIINDYITTYKCYPSETCILKIKNEEERKLFEKVLNDKNKLLKEFKKGVD